MIELAEGLRVVHPEYAFGTVKTIDGGTITVTLDTMEDVTTPRQEWEPAFVQGGAVLSMTQMTDQELDDALERFRSMRQLGAKKKSTSRAKAAQAPTEDDVLNALLERAKVDPTIHAQLVAIGILPPPAEVTPQ